ncbi:hypothetical protein [Actinomadura decatromicini]|uniref:hypothetical protein n=1 Tax=Actinomadura decatromicini TaxID=2604572 RepID=UPI00165307CF|nr:hypothetical protein [Actinomadura decatromicini]
MGDSGYGLRVRRALAWLALLAVLSVAGIAWFGFPHTAKDQRPPVLSPPRPDGSRSP